jgi:hypothetical protein
MARTIFAITAPSVSVPLDNRGHGEIVFTVSNTGGRALRGRAKLIPQDPQQSKWTKIRGEAEREFAINGTQQFSVSVDVPAETKPGKYSFRFDVLSVELPDEESTQGPTVSFSNLSTLPPPNHAFPWWLIVVPAIAVIALGGTAIWFATRGVPQSGPSPGGTSTATSPPGQGDCTYGPDTCKQGFVWREASPSDHVCVEPTVRAEARSDNALAPSRRNPMGGPYGPDTCLQGYVWREAFPGDHVCVSGETRSAAAGDNALAATRKACLR